jgi:ABC-type transport system substrate-binding protein
MNRIDRVVIAGLVLILAVAAIAIGGPALAPKPGPSSAPASFGATVPYREGVLSRPTSVSPLAARTQADRDLVALVFEGLVARTADGRPKPGLARSWTSSETGDSWTFELVPDRRWQDGEPLTADDVAYTIETLQDPDYRGPGAGSWAGITVTAVDSETVRFDLTTPLGGFLELATQPIVPRHLLADTPAGEMADAAFGGHPVGSGPYEIVELDRDHAVLEPAANTGDGSGAAPSVTPAGDPLATPTPTARPADGGIGLRRLEFRFFDDGDVLAAAFRAGTLDAASGLDPAAATALAATPGARAVRYPSTTLAAIALNLRPSEDAFADPRTRRALLASIDRERIVTVVFGGAATRADGQIPPSSWAFDAAASPPVARDAKAAAASLAEAGWTKAKDGWHQSGGEGAADDRAPRSRPREESHPVRRGEPDRGGLAGPRVQGVRQRGGSGRPRDRPPPDRRLRGRDRRHRDRSRPRSVPSPGLEPDPDGRGERHRAPGSAPRRPARGGPQAGHGRGPEGGLQGAPGAPRRRHLPTSDRLAGRGRRARIAGQRAGRAGGRRRVGAIR